MRTSIILGDCGQRNSRSDARDRPRTGETDGGVWGRRRLRHGLGGGDAPVRRPRPGWTARRRALDRRSTTTLCCWGTPASARRSSATPAAPARSTASIRARFCWNWARWRPSVAREPHHGRRLTPRGRTRRGRRVQRLRRRRIQGSSSTIRTDIYTISTCSGPVCLHCRICILRFGICTPLFFLLYLILIFVTTYIRLLPLFLQQEGSDRTPLPQKDV